MSNKQDSQRSNNYQQMNFSLFLFDASVINEAMRDFKGMVNALPVFTHFDFAAADSMDRYMNQFIY